MPRDGSVTLGDLADREMAVLRVSCPKCDRRGGYAVANLVGTHGREHRLTDFLADLTATCPKRRAGEFFDQCGARFPDLGTG